MPNLYKTLIAKGPRFIVQSFVNSVPKNTSDQVVLALALALDGRRRQAIQILSVVPDTELTNQDRSVIHETELVIDLGKGNPFRKKGEINKRANRILELNPKAAIARIFQIELLIPEKQFVAARDTALEVLRDYPDAQKINYYLAQTSILLEDTNLAYMYLKQMPNGLQRNIYSFLCKFWYPYRTLWSIVATLFYLVVIYSHSGIFWFFPIFGLFLTVYSGLRGDLVLLNWGLWWLLTPAWAYLVVFLFSLARTI